MYVLCKISNAKGLNFDHLDVFLHCQIFQSKCFSQIDHIYVDSRTLILPKWAMFRIKYSDSFYYWKGKIGGKNK